jgi:fructosamine-3-kinase
MLELFGLSQLPRVVAAYDEVYPLAEGWRDRLGLHQLVPLLVHAALFGRGYGDRVADTAHRLVG